MQSLQINGELTIYTAHNEKVELQKFLESGDELELNLSGVNEIDTAGLQLLILLKREAQTRNKKLNYTMHSKSVLDVIELANVTASFGDPVVLS